VAKLAVWMLGIPAALLIVLYFVLLATPLPLPFGSTAVQAAARSILPPSAQLELGQMNLALEKGVWPVIQFSPVRYVDSKSGARIDMEALELGFSPIRALVGQPGASVTIVGPQVQMVQDLYGPRATKFEFVEDIEGRQLSGDRYFG
jgi:hypothetical protein